LIDITLQKQAEGKLRQAAKVFDSTQDGIIITDPNGNIVAVNPAFTQITGYREEEAENQNLTFFNSDRQDGATHHHEWWDSPERVNQWQGETRNRKKSGELFAAWENISAVRDSEGGLTNYVVVFSDISNIKDSRERLNYLAYHDPLTDLPNRLLFNARLEHALQQAKRHGRKFAVLFLDLDRFKVINDTLGHKYGDALLKVIAGRLPQCVRAEDTVARLGGDEFVIVLGEVTRAEDAALLAEKVIASITQPITVYDREVIITASIGIGVYPNDADNSLDLIRAADTAMYHAKASGKKTYRFYTAELTTLAFKHLAIEHGLRQALLNNEFVLYYQPMVSLANGNTVCIEALLRWRHPEKGLLEPEDFIGIAEETGIICDIGDWVISEACRQAKSYLVAGLPHVRIAINVSMKQFLNDHLAEKIELACKAAELTRDELDLEIEITESVLQSAEQSIDTLNALHDLGVKLSIDDFGTGYSSLSRLKNFPIDTIKIDRSFVHDLPGDSEGEAIVVAIVALAHTLKLNVVAEGVESLGQHDFLQSHGCNLAQGFLFSKPLTSVEMREFIQRSN
jgi:diguanylate cyclase (GGDEF)-like protein/PAS domain S-box-containing protein